MLKSKLAVQVKNALLNNEHTQDAPIEVSDNGGVITLSGVVASNDIREVAAQITQSEEGVKTVINDISVDEKALADSISPGALSLGMGPNQTTFASSD